MGDIDSLIESFSLDLEDCPLLPFTSKVVIEKRQIQDFLSDIRECILQAKSTSEKQSNQIKDSDSTYHTGVSYDQKTTPIEVVNAFEKEVQATQNALKIKEGANDYADYVLANLQLMITKMHKNLMHLEKNIESGRQILSTQKKESNP